MKATDDDVPTKVQPKILLTYGVHPRAVQEAAGRWPEIERLMESEACVAVGECGLDLPSHVRKITRSAFPFFFKFLS